MKYQNNSTSITGMQISYVSATSIKAGAGNCYDTDNSLFIQFVDDVVLDATKVGANGLDVGSLQANKWYYVHAIYAQTAVTGPALLLSLSETEPYLPAGYSASRMIGRSVRTDGSANIIKFYRRGTLNLRKHIWDTPIQVVTAGVATTDTVFSCDDAIPPVDTIAYLNPYFSPETAGMSLQISPAGSTTTLGDVLSGAVADITQAVFTGEIPTVLVSNESSLQYKVSSADCAANIYVTGFDDPLL